MRHLLTTTTVNIAGSRVNSEVIIAGDRDTRIPHGFFFNDGIIEALLPDIEVRHSIPFPEGWSWNSQSTKNRLFAVPLLHKLQ